MYDTDCTSAVGRGGQVVGFVDMALQCDHHKQFVPCPVKSGITLAPGHHCTASTEMQCVYISTFLNVGGSDAFRAHQWSLYACI